ncbi:MAG: preprotein translocase subunit SecA [Clostridia bacterium]
MKKNLKKLDKLADQVIELAPIYQAMSDSELQGQTAKFKERIKNGEQLDDLMLETFAVCREASRRVLKMEHFKVQVMGGIALYQGRVAEMKTGEGKTLVATLPAYLVGLSGKGIHIITVNEYLARRDCEWMGRVYAYLGLTTGVILPSMEDDDRQKAYNSDITYGTNNEFGFDYLRDNLKVRKEQKVQRELNFAVVDEVDSILIDEARTPLIISGSGTKSSDLYTKANKFVKTLAAEDYEVDEKEKSVTLNESGSIKAEKFFQIESIGDIANKDLHHHIQQALKAHKIFKRDNDYVVDGGEIIIVDEFTGRLMIGRRYSDGLHQAIEAKEGVVIRNENKTHATITFQNYFRLYKHLSGMTGTAKTEEEEFRSIYNLDVIEIPTNLPMQRIDRNDIIYPTQNGKIRAVIKEIKERHEKGMPILVGTITVEKSEELSEALKKEKIVHNVLNAKNHEREAEIVSQAGRFGAVTIATNMAGRGTDILLGGNPEFMAKAKLKSEGVEDWQITMALSFGEIKDEKIAEVRAKYDEYYKEFKVETDAEKVKVKAVGGLMILGTERHESRRIDNQLRGRAGRQGDEGMSVFFISLEDDLAKRFGGETLQSLYEKMKVDEDTAISLGMLSSRIEYAQKVIEGRNFSIRKNILEYDNVMNTQREVIYGERDKVLEGNSVHDDIIKFIPDEVERTLALCIDTSLNKDEWDYAKINKTIEEHLLPIGYNFVTREKMDKWDYHFLKEELDKVTVAEYENKIARYEENGFDFADIERAILLRTVDDKWVDHIDEMDMLRRGISLRAYAQQDPVIAYKSEAFDVFEFMIARIQEDTISVLLKAEFSIVPQVVQKEANLVGGSDRTATQAKSEKTVGRNDPCPCGSGKKYKNCCGK